MFDFTDRSWLWIAASMYLTGFLLGSWALLREKGQSRAWMYAIVSAGFALQTFGLYLRGLEVKGCPLGNTFEVFQFTAWSATVIFLVVGATFRLSLLGYFTSCLSASVTLLSLSIPRWDAARRIGVFGNNSWIEFHAALAIFSYGIFGLLALTSAMYLLQNYSLRNQRFNALFTFLPSIRELDTISRRLLGFGSLALTASLAVGSVYWIKNLQSVNAPKLIFTVAIWFLYVSSWFLRRQTRLVATRLAWTCLILFALALISLKPVNSSRNKLGAPTTTTQR